LRLIFIAVNNILLDMNRVTSLIADTY